MEELTQPPPDLLEMGGWIGRQQAFGLIANKCSAAQALCLKQMKESAYHHQLNLTWAEFCRQYIGVGCRQVDRIIGQYEEFGAAYFRLSKLARISPEKYRAISGAVSDDCIEIDGESVALVPENAARIRAFLNRRRPRKIPPPLTIADIKAMDRGLISAALQQVGPHLSPGDRDFLEDTAWVGVNGWRAVLERLKELG